MRVRIQVRRREEKKERMGKEWAGMGKEADTARGRPRNEPEDTPDRLRQRSEVRVVWIVQIPAAVKNIRTF